MGRREALRIRLAAEDVLNLWRNTPGSADLCIVQYCIRPGQRSIRVSVAGPSVNPNTDFEESELDAAGNVILESLGLSPMYRYIKGVNQVDFPVLVLAAEPILDFLLTAVNSHAQVMLIILTADNLKLLDRKMLTSDIKNNKIMNV